MKNPLRLVLSVTPLLAVLLLSSLPAMGQEKELKPGFRDLKWKDPLPSGMEKLDGEGEDGFYKRDADKLSIGDVKLESIHYIFFQNQFSSYIIETKRGSALLRILTENWGNPSQDNEFIKKYRWVQGDTRTGYEINEITDEGTLISFSKSLYQEQEKARKEKAAKAKPDL